MALGGQAFHESIPAVSRPVASPSGGTSGGWFSTLRCIVGVAWRVHGRRLGLPFPSPKFRTSLAFAVELLNEPALLKLVHEAQIDEILRLGVCSLGIDTGLDLQGVF
jgi:hypothetical protein